jgi:4-amino-4-deoxy-L-arabinose transferase-like glycosyltransferase
MLRTRISPSCEDASTVSHPTVSARVYLPLLTIAAFGLRVAFSAGHEVITNDSASYLRLAENLATRGEYVGIQGDLELKFPPGYPTLIAFLVWLGLPLLWAGRLVSALAGALLVPFSYAIGQRLGGVATGRLAAVLAAAAPPLVYAGSLTIAEVALALFAVSALAAVLAPGLGRALGAGMLLGLANLVKPEAFGFLLVALGAAAVVNESARLRATSALLAGFLLIAAPWIVFLNTQVDPLLFEGKSGMYGHVCRRLGSGLSYGVAAAGFNEAGNVGPLVRFNQSVGRFVYSNELLAAPAEFIACWMRNAESIVDIAAREAYVHPLILFGAAAGAVRGLLAGGPAARATVVVTLAVIVAVGHVLSGMVTMWIAPRYLLTALVLLTILAAHGLAALGPLAQAPARLTAPRALAAWMLLAVILSWWVRDLPLAFGERLPEAERDVQATIVADAKGYRPRVMAQFAVSSFYADADWVQTPSGALPDIVRYAREQGVTHLVRKRNGSSPTDEVMDAEALGLRLLPSEAAGDEMMVFSLDAESERQAAR